jgi:hypothetical protein
MPLLLAGISAAFKRSDGEFLFGGGFPGGFGFLFKVFA